MGEIQKLAKATIKAFVYTGFSLTYLNSCSKEENSIDPNSDEKSITEFSIPKMLEEAFISEENRSTS